jgi:UDP-glucuronate 4-epimerase
MARTILLTGAAGFIASHTALTLLKSGETVIGIDDLNDYYNPQWKKDNLERLKKFTNFQFFKTDIRDFAKLEEIFKDNKIDLIIHLAARAGVRPSIQKPLLYQEVNVGGTLNLLELARQNQIKDFVFASSSSVYGNQEKVPFSESDPVNKPISPYAATKKAGEMLCYTYSHLYKLNCTCLRFFTVYGPWGRPDMAPYLFTEAILKGKVINKFGDGSSERDYTYIDDIVAGVVAATHLHRPFEIINLGNNQPVSLNQFIALLEKLTAKKMKINQLAMQAGDVKRTYADISKAQKLLNFQPKTSFEDGLKQLIDWYKVERL